MLYEGKVMSVALIVSKKFDEAFNYINEDIDKEKWEKLVESTDYLRFRTEPYRAKNPQTGETIEVESQGSTSEILIAGHWYAFLEYHFGELRMVYSEVYENPNNQIRQAVASVANSFSAIITHDAGDEILKW